MSRQPPILIYETATSIAQLMDDCIAIAGGKGGCGKTTTTVGLGAALSRVGCQPLAVDADLEMPDLHLVAGIEGRPGVAAVAEGVDPGSVAQPASETESLSVVPAGDADLDCLGPALDRLSSVRRPVLLDCPAGAGRDATVPLMAADRTVLVTTPTRESLQDALKTVAMARELDAPPVGVAVVDLSRDGHPREITDDDCRRLFGCPLLGRIPQVGNAPLAACDVRIAYERVAKKVYKRNI